MIDDEINGNGDYADDLTWREQDVLNLLAERLTNREIGERLHLAETTVKDYVSKILSKLYVKNRREAVLKAKALKLINGEQKSRGKTTTSLPIEVTPFVGREDELSDIKQLLERTRLLTLSGPGGIGKTRLAIKGAEEAAGKFKDGIFFVPLAPIHSVEHISQTVAEALKLPLATHEDPQTQLIRHLKDRQMLLVMDNFEHLLDGVGILKDILSSAPEVKFLVTSREILNLHAETNISIDGLKHERSEQSNGNATNDASRLFLQSSRKALPGYSPSEADIGQINHICEMVEGLPLAIELAAAWLHILDVNEIAEELEKGIGILASKLRDTPERHRSMRAVFNHSWQLLAHEEGTAFMKLSVFRGGFTRDAAQFVSKASLEMLAGLAGKSFLKYAPVSGRFEIHELLRQYAREQLEKNPAENAEALENQAAYFAEFMDSRGQQLKDSRQLKALAEIEADIENVRSGWRFALAQKDVPKIGQYINCLWHVYWIRWWNHAGMELFGKAASAIQDIEGEQAKILWGSSLAFKSYFMGWLGLAEEGFGIASESVKLLKNFDQPEALVFAYRSMIVNAYFLAGFSDEGETIRKMVRLAETTNDKWLKSFSMFAPSMAKLIEGDYLEARRLAEINLELCNELGDRIGSTFPLIALGHSALMQDEYKTAKDHYLRCLEISEETGFPYAIQTSSKYLGKVALTLGDLEEAEAYLSKCLVLSKELGLVRDILILVYEFARLHAIEGKPEGAVELLSLIIQHPASDEYRLLEGRIRDSAGELLKSIEGEMPSTSFEAAVTRGQGLDLDETVRELLQFDPQM